MRYYSLTKILQKRADYNIIFGERSNGKTTALLKYGIKNYIENGDQMAYIRRWRDDLRGKRAETLFNGVIDIGYISQLTEGRFNSVCYLSGKWYLSLYDEGTKKHKCDSEPFCYGFTLSETEHDKSTSYPNVTTIIFDEFLTRKYYLVDEFVLFMNTLSTIIRQRDNVKIFMLGNTVNKYCPYFSEMGLKHIAQMPQGTIDLYHYGEDNNLTVAVEYVGSSSAKKTSNKYFAFDNPKLQMITGGKWELDLYPHLQTKYTPKDIVFVFFLISQGVTLQCDVVALNNKNFIFVHKKTTPIKNPDTDLIYTTDEHDAPNYHRRLISNLTKADKQIARYFAQDKVFYQDNDVGEIIRNYIMVTTPKINI